MSFTAIFPSIGYAEIERNSVTVSLEAEGNSEPQKYAGATKYAVFPRSHCK
jgi:hypothetical protein